MSGFTYTTSSSRTIIRLSGYINRRLALNEQYLLEAFLSFNNSFAPQLANYWICLDHARRYARLWSNVTHGVLPVFG